ncbi:hypothetical protein LXD69_09870 [Flavobacterium sediminilitoris]|uniref:Uncharacterized protein n=1 Tax=Flavobacterium sediminilitoris TaxID=2024526 RepID=A0ABY4HI28_9FLAO|nr:MULTISPECIES: hypothetical protein [Flavobacterium]UOX32358.1 hypothetical protein LXD69_09870 [Flavobacterium sediminilitoris]
MAGEGSMMHANTSLKNNRRNRKSRLENFVNTTSNGYTEFVDPNKATPEVLAEIREKLQVENKIILRKKIIITTAVLVLIIITLTVLNQFL